MNVKVPLLVSRFAVKAKSAILQGFFSTTSLINGQALLLVILMGRQERLCEQASIRLADALEFARMGTAISWRE